MESERPSIRSLRYWRNRWVAGKLEGGCQRGPAQLLDLVLIWRKLVDARTW